MKTTLSQTICQHCGRPVPNTGESDLCPACEKGDGNEFQALSPFQAIMREAERDARWAQINYVNQYGAACG